MTEPRLTRREFVRLAGAGLSMPFLAGFSSPVESRLRAIRDRALDFTGRGEVPSLSIAVIQAGRPIWVEAFGWADRERKIRATSTTPFAIASASKPFTGTAVSQLVAAGTLSLEAKLGEMLGDIAARQLLSEVTVRQALQHRSGIPRHWRNFFAGQGHPPAFDIVARDHAFVTGARGERYRYSNMNYGLLAAAVEAVAGRPFHEHLREQIFRPLGLTTAMPLAEHFGAWRAAVAYEDDGTPIPPYLVDEQGARDLVMSAFDLARFGAAHLDGRLGAASRLMQSERAAIGANGAANSSYGLGWIIEEDSPAALFSFGHTGEGPGAASSLAVVPAEQLVVATVSNAQAPAAYMLNEAIVDALSAEFAARRIAHPYREPMSDDQALRSLRGSWSGTLETPGGRHRVRLMVAGADESKIVLGSQAAPLTSLAVTDGVLGGRAGITIPDPIAQAAPHQARVLLELHPAGLDGTLAAYASKGALPHDQFWLSYKLGLQRD